jgi:GDSL-like Lipase/Acylhydrolase family
VNARQARAAALLLGCVGAAGAYFFLEPRIRWRLDALVAYRRAATRGTALSRPASGPWRWWLPEETVAQVFPLDSPVQAYDPHSFFRHLAGLDLSVTLREHADGKMVLRTNSLGLREDDEVRAVRPDLRVLVTGDSHTDGACDNSESFAHRLEASLARARPEKSVEVLNAGKGGYHFFNYRGVLERFRGLEPHVFLVVVYGGNDFEEQLPVHHLFAGTERPPGAERYLEKVDAAVRIHPSPAQGLLACKYFQQNPDQVDVALSSALALCEEIASVAASRGTAAMFAYLPPPYAPAPPEFRSVVERMTTSLDLVGPHLAVFDRMADRFLDGLALRRIPALDLRPVFREEKQLLYWHADHHLNVAGHAVVARALEPFVAAAARW